MVLHHSECYLSLIKHNTNGEMIRTSDQVKFTFCMDLFIAYVYLYRICRFVYISYGDLFTYKALSQCMICLNVVAGYSLYYRRIYFFIETEIFK